MYIFLYMIGVILSAVAFHWSFQNTSRKPGTPTFGLFRYVDVPGQKATDASTEKSPRPRHAGRARR